MLKTRDRRSLDTFSQATLVKEFLLEEMRNNRIPEGGQLPTEHWLMDEFKVNRAMVRKVMNELSDEGVVERHQGRGTFRLSKGRRRERTGLVGVWFNWPGAAHWSPVMQGIRDVMSQSDYHCVFEGGGLNPGDEGKGIQCLVRKGLDGFIVARSSHLKDDHHPLEELIHNNVPLVLIERPFEQYQVDIVKSYLELGAVEIVEHFHRLNHRRIAYLGVRGLLGKEERLIGYERTMQRLGLTVFPGWIQEFDRLDVNINSTEADTDSSDILVTVAGTRISKEDCRRAINALLELPGKDRPTAIFAVNMTVAKVLVEVLREHNLKIPESISVATFSEASSQASPEDNWITSYEEPSYRIGEQAAQLLLDRINQPDKDVTKILLQGKLICRNSVQSL